MLKKTILTALVIAITACSDSVETTNTEAQHNEIDEIKQFILPDTLDVKPELVIAAYYEIHPKKACVIFAYNDTTRNIARKYCYYNDSSFVVKDLINMSYNEFKLKDEPSEIYIIKPATVVWMHQSGNLGASSEYERIDLPKWLISLPYSNNKKSPTIIAGLFFIRTSSIVIRTFASSNV